MKRRFTKEKSDRKNSDTVSEDFSMPMEEKRPDANEESSTEARLLRRSSLSAVCPTIGKKKKYVSDTEELMSSDSADDTSNDKGKELESLVDSKLECQDHELSVKQTDAVDSENQNETSKELNTSEISHEDEKSLADENIDMKKLGLEVQSGENLPEKFSAEILNSYKSAKWQPGDVVWAGLRTYPLWPSIVVEDKDSGSYLQTKTEQTSPGKVSAPRKYYLVRFFGDNFSRGWVSSKYIFKYIGVEFYYWLQKCVKTNKSLKSEYGSYVKSNNSYKKKWVTAVSEAHSMLELERPERILKFNYMMSSSHESTKISKPKKVVNVTKSKAINPVQGEWMPPQIHEDSDDFVPQAEEYVTNKEISKEYKKYSLAQCKSEVTNSESPNVPKVSESHEDQSVSTPQKISSKKLGQGRKKEMVCQNLDKKFWKSYSSGKKPCVICEESVPNSRKCAGKCRMSYHPSCCGRQVTDEEEFTCHYCSENKENCFVCKGSDGTLLKCKEQSCVKLYHEGCLKLFPQAYIYSDCVSCPYHLCHTCASDNPKDTNLRVRTTCLVKCLRCPSAYHPSDRCIPAGTQILTGGAIICPKHFTPKGQPSCSVSWCFICSMGGSLICCETCPASFHSECLNIDTPEGNYFCEDCESGRLPLYGDIVWAKCGNFRWWPAEIVHPRNVPTNVSALPHSPHQFCIQFFGTYDFCYSDREKVFRFETGDQCTNSQSKKTSPQFKRAVEEAANAHDALRLREASQSITPLGNEKPPCYTKIKTNRPIDVSMPELDLSQMTQCECDPLQEHPCGPDSHCLNRIMMIECHPSVCVAKDRCENQRFRKCQYPALETFKVIGRGWGLKTMQDVKKGEFICEYVGELISSEECHRRIQLKQKYNDENHYFLTLDKDRIIDAGPKGNLSRFMNHSCAPNCESQKWTVNSDTRVGLFAVCDIPAGSELTFDYKLEAVGSSKKICECGAPNCSGFIGEKAKPTEIPKLKVELKKKAKKKKKKKIIEDIESQCYHCSLPGTLLPCNHPDCPKAYHPDCLGPKFVSHNFDLSKWVCPWHFCNICGIYATQFCFYCSSSYCESHNEISEHDVLGSMCPYHESSGIQEICDMLKIYNLGKTVWSSQ